MTSFPLSGIIKMKYTDKVIDHFQNPRNLGTIENPDAVGKVTSPVCGDIMELHMKIKDNIITDVKFRTFGCAAAVASSSILTEMIKDKTLEEALKITNQRIAEALGGLPEEKLHCSVLAEEGVKSAITSYLEKQKSSQLSN